MKSMTGYGRGEHAENGVKVTVEASSVNRRQLEVAVSLPREMDSLEPRVREEIGQRIARGRLSVRITLAVTRATAAGELTVNLALAKAYARQLQVLAAELKLEPTLSLEVLARAPGVLQAQEPSLNPDQAWEVMAKALNKALGAVLKMREREGAHLAKDLAKRIALLRKSTAKIQKHAPQVMVRYREQLRKRIQQAGLSLPAPEDERLLKELVYFADRSDISEELARLQSHFQQFDDTLKSAEPVGRTLDFLAQEMNREVNTIGAKANDSLISREVVALKAELEKFREQAQNVE